MEGTDGIMYEPADPQTPSGVSFVSDRTYLPFLNDTVTMPKMELPFLETSVAKHSKARMQRYQSAIGDVISVDEHLSKRVNLPIVGRVVLKSRVRAYSFFKRNAYCFQIVMQGARNLKVTLWGKCAAYHAGIETGDFVVIQEYRRGKRNRSESYIVYNSFHEDLYLNASEISVNSGAVYRTQMTVPVGAGLSLKTPLNNVVEGKITYMSVITRHRSRWEEYTDIYEYVYEYYLLRVGDKAVILYSNSTETFYELEVGMQVRLENMRAYVRGSVHMYLSTIYTEILVCEDACPDSGLELVRGALGFIPDRGLDLSVLEEERVESFQIGKREIVVAVAQLWRPEPVTLADLDKNTSTLVINEARKYVLRARLAGYNFASFSKEECAVRSCAPETFTSVSYLKNGVLCEQRSAAICVEDDSTSKTLLLFKNYLHSEGAFVERIDGCSTLEELSSLVGSWFNFIVDVFRASEHNALVHGLFAVRDVAKCDGEKACPMQADYYPSLFDRKKGKVEEVESIKEYRPVEHRKELRTLYDEATIPQKLGRRSFVTIFGSSNLEMLEEKVRSLGEVRDIEYGRNYLNVVYDSEESNRSLLSLNRQVVNGEILGVYRQQLVVNSEDNSIFIRNKSMFSRVVEYFFGSQC
ncbi:UNVERIFIED_CONTAM: hypothetical protein PYX00_011627 [Menopon gallinae]|uniref:Uncharacterized protein n=1 Tax=Menopon gallinae TaxID=328185 RepID=A0AAW2H820_9NEOP